MSDDHQEASSLQPPTPDVIVYLYPTASTGKRFLNFLIDTITAYALIFMISFGIAVLAEFVPGAMALLEGVVGFIVIYGSFFAYFAVLEAMIGRTLGKLLTNTLVLNLRDEKPTLGQILGRSAARFIPFEPFSFLGSSGSGWHDALPKTKVVDTSKAPNVLGRDLTVKRAISPNSVSPGMSSPPPEAAKPRDPAAEQSEPDY